METEPEPEEEWEPTYKQPKRKREELQEQTNNQKKKLRGNTKLRKPTSKVCSSPKSRQGKYTNIQFIENRNPQTPSTGEKKKTILLVNLRLNTIVVKER